MEICAGWNDYEMCFSTEDFYNNDIGIELSREDRQKLMEIAEQFERPQRID